LSATLTLAYQRGLQRVDDVGAPLADWFPSRFASADAWYAGKQVLAKHLASLSLLTVVDPSLRGMPCEVLVGAGPEAYAGLGFGGDFRSRPRGVFRMTQGMVGMLGWPGLYGTFAHVLSRCARAILRPDVAQVVMTMLKADDARLEIFVEGKEGGVDWLIEQALKEPEALRAKDAEWKKWV